jgi:hypothetical protein
MKAVPVRLVHGQGYEPCAVAEATYVTLNIPETGLLTLPVILRGRRKGTAAWTWNGSTEAPTLRPSVLTTRPHMAFRSHAWIADGKAQFLDDCSHPLRGTTVDLLDVPEP